MPIKKKVGLLLTVFFGFVALFSIAVPTVSQFKSLQFPNLNQISDLFRLTNPVDIAVINLGDYDYVACPVGDTDVECNYFGGDGLIKMVAEAPTTKKNGDRVNIFIKNGDYGGGREVTFSGYRGGYKWHITGESRDQTRIYNWISLQSLKEVSFDSLTLSIVGNGGMSPKESETSFVSFNNVRFKNQFNLFTGLNVTITNSAFFHDGTKKPCLNLHSIDRDNTYPTLAKLNVSIVNTTFSCFYSIYLPNAEYVNTQLSLDRVSFLNSDSYYADAYDLKLDATFNHKPDIKILDTNLFYGVVNPGNIPLTVGSSTPVGYIDKVDSSVVASGWACDANKFNDSIYVHLYANKPAGQQGAIFLGGYKADGNRPDVSGLCGGTTKHGYTVTLDQINTNKDKIADYQPHRIYVYAINIKSDGTGDGSNNPSLVHSGGSGANLDFALLDNTPPTCGDWTFTPLDGADKGKIKINTKASDDGSGLIRGGLYISSAPNTDSADFGAIPNNYSFGPQKDGEQSYTWNTNNLAPGKYAVASNWWDNSGKPNVSTNDKPGGHLGNFIQCRKDYTIEAVLTVVERPAYCKSISLSTSSTNNELKEGEILTLSSTANTDKIKKFSFAFFNKDNLTTGENPTLKGIMYEAGKQFYPSFVPLPNEPVYTGSTQVSYNDLHKPDTNWGNKIPQNIQVNAYFTDGDNKVSAGDPACVASFILKPKVVLPVTHLECVRDACKQVAGAGENKCNPEDPNACKTIRPCIGNLVGSACEINMLDLLDILAQIVEEKPYNIKYDLAEPKNTGAIDILDLLFVLNLVIK